MRPRHVCRGMSSGRTSSTRRCRSCFNEAPACLPGNGGGPDGRARGRVRFNEAPACLPGNAAPGGTAPRQARPHASMRPRHVCRGMRFPSPLPHADGDASMRPRHVCRGMRRGRRRSRGPRRPCFNEAPACLPGNGPAPRQESCAPLRLASMRPRHVCRGMDEAGARAPRKAGTLHEAPACLPGNGGDQHRVPAAHGAASMRPRHVCRGMWCHCTTPGYPMWTLQ